MIKYFVNKFKYDPCLTNKKIKLPNYELKNILITKNFLKLFSTNFRDNSQSYLNFENKLKYLEEKFKNSIHIKSNEIEPLLISDKNLNKTKIDIFYYSNKVLKSLIIDGNFIPYIKETVSNLDNSIINKDNENIEKYIGYLELDVDSHSLSNIDMFNYVVYDEITNKLKLLYESKLNEYILKKLKKIILFYSFIIRDFEYIKMNVEEVIKYDNELFRDFEVMRLIKETFYLTVFSKCMLNNDNEKALIILNKAISNMDKLKNHDIEKLKDILQVDIAELYRGLNIAYLNENDLEMSLKMLDKIEFYDKENNNLDNLCITYYIKARINYDLQNTDYAIKYIMKFFEILNMMASKDEDISNKSFYNKLEYFESFNDEIKKSICFSLIFLYQINYNNETDTIDYFENMSLEQLCILMYDTYYSFFQLHVDEYLFQIYIGIIVSNYNEMNFEIVIRLSENLLQKIEDESSVINIENDLKKVKLDIFFILANCYLEIDIDKSYYYLNMIYNDEYIENLESEKEEALNELREKIMLIKSK